MTRGRFVVVEGGEGSGKSTQVRRLAERLRTRGLTVRETFEPGATPLGRALRRLLLDDDVPLGPRAELLLMAADRAQHVAEVVRPALEAGEWVVSDRFAPSTLAYQGVARGLGTAEVGAVSDWATAGIVADLVVVLDVPDDVARQRRPVAVDRMEREPPRFHATVRSAYRELAVEHGWAVVDGTGGPGDVGVRVWAALVAAGLAV